MPVTVCRPHRIEVEALCWLMTAFAELDRVATLPVEAQESVKHALKSRQRERIARAFEAAADSLGELRTHAYGLAQAVRGGELSTLRRLVFEIARAA